MAKLTIVAEVGSTWRVDDWEESRKLALDAVVQAAECGATAVKFQLFRADTLYARTRAPDLWERVSRYQLPIEWLHDLRLTACRCGVQLWASVFDPKLIPYAAPFLDCIKIASGDLTYETLITEASKVATANLVGLCLSTGAATTDEVDLALEWVFANGQPDPLILMECVSSYPAHPTSYNLRGGLIFEDIVSAVGVSDHTPGATVAQIAVGAGYTVFEKHFEPLGGDGQSPDHLVSLNPDKFRTYANQLRLAQRIMGKREKKPKPAELGERVWARRGKDGLRPKEEAEKNG